MIVYHKSRGAGVLDHYMDKYRGIVMSDKLPVYRRFDPGGHQLCWSHEMRQLLYASQKKDAHLSVHLLYRQIQKIYHDARDSRDARCASLRIEFECRMRHTLESYRDAEGVLAQLVRRLSTSLPYLFVFLEYPGVEPTNNASERALRHVVVSRKINGQIKGGQEWMDRWSWFMTCTLTWKAQGKSIMDEVAKIV